MYVPAPIHLAARDGNLAKIKQLIQEDPQLLEAKTTQPLPITYTRQIDDREATPLIIASYRGDNEMVQWLISQGADVHARTKKLQRVPLHWVSHEGHKSTAAILLANGADINAVHSNYNITPLMQDVAAGYIDMVQMYLACPELRIDQADALNRTALFYACTCFCRRREIVKMLLEAGADPGIANNVTKTTPSAVSEQMGYPVIVALLKVSSG